MIGFADSHVTTDNKTRSLIQDTITSFYNGQTPSNKPTPWALQVRDTMDLDGDRSQARYWQAEKKAHEPYPRLSDKVKPVASFITYHDRSTNLWEGDIIELSVALGITIPTVVQSALPLAIALYLTQNGGKAPETVTFGRTVNSECSSDLLLSLSSLTFATSDSTQHKRGRQ